jgi:hypothetical protein
MKELELNWQKIHDDFIAWDTEGKFNFSQKQIFEWFKEQLEAEIEQEPLSVYDENYLNECIEKATPNLSKITDVDKEIAEIRGGGPEGVTVDEMLKGCEHDGSYIPVTEVKKLMEAYAKSKEINLRKELIKFAGNWNKKLFGCDNKYLISTRDIKEYLTQKDK